jgi:hypothetical protein
VGIIAPLGALVVAPVTEVGNVAKWTGQEESSGKFTNYASFTVWPDGDNRLIGDIEHPQGIVEFTCTTETVPAITSTASLEIPGAGLSA